MTLLCSPCIYTLCTGERKKPLLPLPTPLALPPTRNNSEIENQLQLCTVVFHSDIIISLGGRGAPDQKVQRATQLGTSTPALQRPLYGRAVASVNGFWYGSCGDCLVGHWHGRLARALAEEPPVGRPVFALHGGAEAAAAAERVMQRQRAAARTLRWGQCPAQGPPMVRKGQRRRSPLPGQESGHSECRGGVVPHGLRSLDQRGLAGLHAADVQRRDLDRGAGDLLVGQVLVQKTVHTTVHLFQIHLLVLQEEEEDGGRQERTGGGHRG